MPIVLKLILQVIGVVAALLIAIVVGYIIYLEVDYGRIPDSASVEVDGNPPAKLSTQTEYTAATYNIGFGAYTPDYTFFELKG